MIAGIVVIFILGYLAIAFEHSIKINKTAIALLTGILCWTLFILSEPTSQITQSEAYTSFLQHLKIEAGEKFKTLSTSDFYHEYILYSLAEELGDISQILFFLMGAMTVVELVDAHQGFRFITDKINTRSPKKLLWIICWVSFFLSAVLDNLTTTIVVVSLVRKLIPNRDLRLFFIGMTVVAANAGGAWSPIGDVTTTMLWIGGQITTANIILTLFLPSVICLLIPLLFLSFTLKGTLGEQIYTETFQDQKEIQSGKLMLIMGTGILIFVPVFKTITHLPPYAGMLIGLGVIWVVSEIINPHLNEATKKEYTAAGALSRIDVPSILFFLGILLAVGALNAMQVLNQLALWLDGTIGDQRIIVTFIGMLSSIVDNVPLVAASMGMYSMDVYYPDHMFWEYLAYCAGTGGSLLIIGSAAGVAAMGMEKIDFIWYLKKISLLALLGYFAGAISYLILQPFLSGVH